MVPGELNLDSIFEKLTTIAASSSHILTLDNYNELKVIYENQLSGIAAKILDEYNEQPPERRTTGGFNLSPEQIQKLNAGEPIIINLMDMGRFLPSEDNIRIVNLAVKDIDVHLEDGEINLWADLDLYMEHSGVSNLGSPYKTMQVV